MLDASGLRSVAAGNIGTPLIHYAGSGPETGLDVVVAEVSSFQLEFTVEFRPVVAVLLGVADDHLDWHGSLRRVRGGEGADLRFATTRTTCSCTTPTIRSRRRSPRARPRGSFP